VRDRALCQRAAELLGEAVSACGNCGGKTHASDICERCEQELRGGEAMTARPYLPEDEVEQDVAARIQQDKPYVHEEDQIAALAGMLSRLRALRAELDERTRERDSIKEIRDLLEASHCQIEAENDRLRAALKDCCDVIAYEFGPMDGEKDFPDNEPIVQDAYSAGRAALAGNEGAGE
jgi:hypothetical protein